jgi:hypothetical protein
MCRRPATGCRAERPGAAGSFWALVRSAVTCSCLSRELAAPVSRPSVKPSRRDSSQRSSAWSCGISSVCPRSRPSHGASARLADRGDDPALLPDHRAFAAWMRGHARDPRHMPHVLTTGGWEAMRWDRWVDAAPADGAWAMEVVDTTARSPEQVSAEILAWCRRGLTGQAPGLRPRRTEHQRLGPPRPPRHAGQRERRLDSARRIVMSFFTSAFGRGRSTGKCRELLVIV